MKLRYFLLCLLYIVVTPFVFGQASQIKINEFLIEPTPQIVELLNTGTEIVDLSNWFIDDNGGTTYFTIPTGTQLYPNACISFSGSLNLNRATTDAVRLFDSTAPPTSSSANLIDSFEYESSSGSGVTFQRIPDGQSIWSTGSANFDFYNLTGLSCKVAPTPTTQPLSTPIPTPAGQSPLGDATPTPTSMPTISAIYLSEVYPYPGEGENEWVELYNDNAFSVSLIDWKIDDVADAGSSPKKFSMTIPAYSYKILDLTSSIFNNDGDDVRLLSEGNSLFDSFSYDGAEKQLSFGRVTFSSNTYCLQKSSMGHQNNGCKITEAIESSTDKEYEEESNLNYSETDTIYPNPLISSSEVIEQVRPTQYYQRPVADEESVLAVSSDKNQNTDKVQTPEAKQKTVIKSLALTSAITSFLTVGLIFIKIIL